MFLLAPRSTACGLLAAIVWTSGCVSVPWTQSAGIAAANPQRHAGMTIIFVESPRDVCSISGLPFVADHFNAHGIHSIYFDPWLDKFDAQGLAELARSVKVDQGRRVMLVGWSLGAAMSLDAIDILGTQGVDVDTCVILDCFNLNLHRGLRVEPSNVGRLVVARSQAFAFPAGFQNAVPYVIGTWNHLAVPTHPTTIEMLFAEAELLSECQQLGI